MASVPRIRFELESIAAQLDNLLAYARRQTLPLRAELRVGDEWRPLPFGEPWAGPMEMHTIRAGLAVPSGWTGKLVATIVLGSYLGRSSPEGLVRLNGRAIQGVDRFHHDVLLDGLLAPGDSGELTIEAFSSRPEVKQSLARLELALIDVEAEALYHDVRVLVDAVAVLPPESLERIELLRALEAAYRALDLRHPMTDEYLCSVARAREILRTDAFGRAGGPEPRITSAGHAHLDLAWLWPVSQTRRKGLRTFSTALRQMERYPQYHFAASQPALYQMVKEDDPELFERVVQRMGEGRWEAVAATWVEMDCNLPGGESLVRQFLFGKQFCREELGVDPTVLFLPDVFGYSAALPQIMADCGVPGFMTTKISWNEYNRIPYDTFRWEGIDGTQVLTHMVTAADLPGDSASPGSPQQFTYNGTYRPDQILANWDAYQQKSINEEILYLFGYGDGGGGPSIDMQEAALRLSHLPGFPRVEQGSVQEFFGRVRERVWDDPLLPRWVGELYLEYHRGTYTSQAWLKRANRMNELLYREAELWSSVAGALVDPVAMAGRQAILNGGWTSLLFNQFHDILPGSSIHEVYEDARRDHAEITRIGNEVRNGAIQEIASAVASDGGLLVFNPAPFPREDPVEVQIDASELADFEGDVQRVTDGHCLVATSAPPLGYEVTRGGTRGAAGDLRIERNLLENSFFRVELADDGTITSLMDKRVGREVIAAGERGNRLIAFEDRPRHWDAWELQLNYNEKPYPVDDVASWEIVEEGPLRGGVKIVRRYQRSVISQHIFLYRDVPRIDFRTTVDWHERQTLLKVAFPVNVHSARATYDIQWGNVERPTHWNTSWDWARFETCAHKWVDLSEGDYGVSLLNDCKYGHDIRGNVMRLSLLKSPVSPDPEADQGMHAFSYALLPHLGDWRTGQTVRHAYLFNMPASAQLVQPRSDGTAPESFSFARCERPGCVLETVKPAENGDGLIVRGYDAHNTRGGAEIAFGLEVDSAESVSMLEETRGGAEVVADRLQVPVRPYGIWTYRIRPSKSAESRSPA